MIGPMYTYETVSAQCLRRLELARRMPLASLWPASPEFALLDAADVVPIVRSVKMDASHCAISLIERLFQRVSYGCDAQYPSARGDKGSVFQLGAGVVDRRTRNLAVLVKPFDDDPFGIAAGIAA